MAREVQQQLVLVLKQGPMVRCCWAVMYAMQQQ